MCKEKIEVKVSKEFRVFVYETLRDLGINMSIKGYKFLTDAILACSVNPEYIYGGITKYLYPYIAKLNETTESRAERAMRHAIEQVISKGNTEKAREIFGNYISEDLESHLTNSEFVARITEYIRAYHPDKIGIEG